MDMLYADTFQVEDHNQTTHTMDVVSPNNLKREDMWIQVDPTVKRNTFRHFTTIFNHQWNNVNMDTHAIVGTVVFNKKLYDERPRCRLVKDIWNKI